MKKTLSVNLGGAVYHIDEDAYHELMDYLQDVKRHLGDEVSSEEVLNDIEQRISELFSQWMQGRREVITIFDVRKVVDVLGRPEQYGSAENSAGDDSAKRTYTQKEDSNRTSGNAHRKLYRDTDNSVLGGVCAGFAEYLNVSMVLVRLLFVLLFIFYGSGLLFYIICWLIIPEARTAAQRLEMRGEDVTIDNIEKTVREEYGRVKNRVDGYVSSDRFKQNARSAESGFLKFIRFCAKFFLAIVAGFFILIGLIVLVALVVALVAIWSGAFNMGLPWMEHMPFHQILMDPISATFMSLALLLVFGIPLFAIFRLIFGRMLNMQPARNWEIWVGLLLWFVGVGLCTFFSLSPMTTACM